MVCVRTQTFKTLQALLDKDIRSVDFNLEVVCQRAKERGHPDMPQVLAFKEAIGTPLAKG